jgi:cell division protein FtsL
MRVLSRKSYQAAKNKISFLSLPYSRVFLLLLVVIISLVGVKLYLTNLLATSGVRLTATSQKIERLEDEKVRLENEISRLGAVSRLQKEAKKLGFLPTKKIELLTKPKPLAQKP